MSPSHQAAQSRMSARVGRKSKNLNCEVLQKINFKTPVARDCATQPITHKIGLAWICTTETKLFLNVFAVSTKHQIEVSPRSQGHIGRDNNN